MATTIKPPTGTGELISVQSNNGPSREAWIKYTNAVRTLLVADPKSRILDQYLVFRDKVMEHIQSEEFLSQFVRAWNNNFAENTKTAELLLLEMNSCALSIEIANSTATETKKKKKPGLLKRLFGGASTVAGSVSDLLENLPPLVKGGITLFKELIDFFKGE